MSTIDLIKEPSMSVSTPPTTLKDLNSMNHPVEMIQNEWTKQEESRNAIFLSKIYGSTCINKINLEHSILKQFNRPIGFGITSNNIGYEALTGKDEEIDVQDYLGPDYGGNFNIDYRSQLETKFGDAPLNRFA